MRIHSEFVQEKKLTKKFQELFSHSYSVLKLNPFIYHNIKKVHEQLLTISDFLSLTVCIFYLFISDFLPLTVLYFLFIHLCTERV